MKIFYKNLSTHRLRGNLPHHQVNIFFIPQCQNSTTLTLSIIVYKVPFFIKSIKNTLSILLLSSRFNNPCYPNFISIQQNFYFFLFNKGIKALCIPIPKLKHGLWGILKKPCSTYYLYSFFFPLLSPTLSFSLTFFSLPRELVSWERQSILSLLFAFLKLSLSACWLLFILSLSCSFFKPSSAIEMFAKSQSSLCSYLKSPFTFDIFSSDFLFMLIIFAKI